MNVCVVIPFGGHDPDRKANLRSVVDFYAVVFPECGVRVSTDHGKPFNRARAVNGGVRQAPAPIVVINDADSICHPDALRHAVTVASHRDVLVQAYTAYQRLDREGNVIFLQEQTDNHGCVAVRRRVFLDAGGYDESYEGWGYEDLDLNRRIPLLRVPGALTHLWHEPAEPNMENRDRFEATRG